ncbi:MAG: hypothetical protein BYD32DRAFT_491267 [Podila humilis]|nr:MAG: hypothetical protein BYD32DRAFT_491267 [Podila humilis]
MSDTQRNKVYIASSAHQKELSHSNVLFIIQLICASPVVELCSQNVRLQECRDWELIVDSVYYSLLKVLDLGAACIGQLVSIPDAANLFISRVEQARKDTEGAKLMLRAFTMDFTVLSHPNLAVVQEILNVCRLEELRFECPPFNPRLSASICLHNLPNHASSKEAMESSAQPDPPVSQKFKAKDDSPLPSLRTHLCTESGERFLFWADVQHAFNGIDHLKAWWRASERILFTIDATGELCRPLRIPHRSFAYVVVHMTLRNDQTEDFSDGQVDTQDQPLDEIVPSLKHLFYLYNHLESINKSQRGYFRQVAANTQYYHSMVVEELERLDSSGVKVVVDDKNQGQLLKEIHDIQRRVPEWEYRNTCYHTLHGDSRGNELVTSALFLTLPSDLNSWNGLDPSTHQFRLHFLCDNNNRDTIPENLPQHVHLSNHPGYSLRQPEEFFQKYGDYILRMLQMIKHGYTDNDYDIPPLDTLKILWDCDSNIIGSCLTMDIESLVDRAISYFQELSLPKWKEKLGLTHDQSAAIKTYLDVQDGNSAESNLYRCISERRSIYWKCEAHAHQSLSSQSLEHLREFVHFHGGHVNMQQARIRVELGSIDESDQFRTLLCNVKHTFDVSIKLCWEATRPVVRKLCLDIANSGTVFLELDSITLDIHPQGYDQYRNNLFFHDVISKSNLRFISLLNYPRPQEQCIHVYQYSLQLETPIAESFHNRMALWSDMDMFLEVALESQDHSEWKSAATTLQTTLEKHELSGTYMVTIYNDKWNAVFDPKRGIVVEVHLEDMVCPKSLLSTRSIQTLGVHLNSRDFSHEFFSTARINTDLQDLIVSYYGHNIFYHLEHIVRMWYESSSSFCLTLLDRMRDTRGRVVAQLGFGESNREDPSDGTIDLHGCDISSPFSRKQAVHEPTDVVFTQWDCDHVFSKISDYSASFLDMASRQHPSVLTLFTLDVSCLSRDGLSTVREVLRRSDLEHLHVVCTPVNSQSESIAQVLGSVQWSTLKSLVFVGNNIEAWIDLCQPPLCPSLLSLQIQGTWPNIQELSHSNVLLIIQLISASPIIELCFQNAQLQESRDWELIVDSVDYSLLKVLDLGAACIGQLVSIPDAANLFISRVEQARKDTEVLASVNWTFLERLDLTGCIINEWIQLFPNIKTPRLQSIVIQGSERLQDRLDWARLVESMDLWLVGSELRVEGSSREQFEGMLEAVQLEQEKE